MVYIQYVSIEVFCPFDADKNIINEKTYVCLFLVWELVGGNVDALPDPGLEPGARPARRQLAYSCTQPFIMSRTVVEMTGLQSKTF